MSARAPAPPRLSSRQHGQRIESLKDPLPRAVPRIHKPRPERCINPDCEEPNRLEVEDGKLVCESCGTVAEDSVDLVTDVSFGLEGGRAVLHGQHVAADASHARGGETLRGGLSSLEKSIGDGKRYIDMVTHALHITEGPKKAADLFYRLAANANFIQGRRIRAVAAVCLYVGCRSQRDSHNLHMLIDFADVLNIDVFHLGSIYQDFLKEISINGAGYWVQPINPEHLILRFAARLEFEGMTMKVANDAVRIVQRMDRDWMTPGRRPAGVCGAALIIAARMNNFRRTPREMMYVVKVNDMTIVKRLEEFKDLESSGLTVEDFRVIWLDSTADPPAFAQNKKDRDKRGKKRKDVEFDDDGDDLGDQPNAADMIPPELLDPPEQMEEPARRTRRQSQTEEPRVSKRARGSKRQAAGAVAIPVDPALQSSKGTSGSQPGKEPAQANPTRSTRSRTKRVTNDQVDNESDATAGADAVPSTAGGDSQAPLGSQSAPAPPAKRKRGRPRRIAANGDNVDNAEITAALADPFEQQTGPATWQAVVDVATGAEDERANNVPHHEIPTSETIGEEEFADDPEVNHCLLSPEEVEIKTRIWTSVNFDWLRAKAAKAYQHELEVAAGTFRPKKVRIRRRRRIGDLSTYAGDLGPDWEKRIEESGGLADSAAESVRMMLENRMYGRGKALSSKINYDKIRELYTPSSNATRRTSEVGADSPGSGGPGSVPRPAMTATMIDQTQASEDSTSSAADSPSGEHDDANLGLSGTTMQSSTTLTSDQLPVAADIGTATTDPQATLADDENGNGVDEEAEEEDEEEDGREEGEESGWKSGQFDNSYEDVGNDYYE